MAATTEQTRVEKLEEFIRLVIRLTASAQPGVCLQTCQTLNRMARDIAEGE